MPKLRALTEAPPLARGDAENQLEELRDYLVKIVEELEYLLTHIEADNINDSTFERIQSMIPTGYTGLPAMDGAASPGGSGQWARGDHRHPTDTSRAAESDLSGHTGDTNNPHSVTKAQVGLDNVANERQYSVNNPPPVPTPAEVGAVPVEREINGYPLSADITLTASDVGAREADWTPSAADVGAVPTSRTVNGKALSSDITLTAEDVGAGAPVKAGSISLSATWTGAASPYTQTVTVSGATVTANSKIDLMLTASQLASLGADGVYVIVIENNGGTLTACAVGAAPTAAMTVACAVTEVTA